MKVALKPINKLVLEMHFRKENYLTSICCEKSFQRSKKK